MRKPMVGDSGFWLSFIFNLALNFEGGILVAILAICHVIFGIPQWLVWGALALWVGGVFIMTIVIYVTIKWSSSAKPVETQATTRYSSRGDGALPQPEEERE